MQAEAAESLSMLGGSRGPEGEDKFPLLTIRDCEHYFGRLFLGLLIASSYRS